MISRQPPRHPVPAMIKCQRRHHVTGCHSPATTSVLDGGLRGVHVAYGNYAKPGIARLEPGSQGLLRVHIRLGGESGKCRVDYVLTTLMTGLMEDDIVEAIRRRAKWENDDYICRGHILNGMSDSIFDIYQNVESAKELWDSLESKYMAEDASSKKFLLPPSWKDFKHTLKHGKDDLSLVQLGSYLRIEESLREQDSDKGKGKEVAGPFTGHFKRDCRSGKKNNANVVVRERGLRTNPKTKVDAIAWWIDSGATTHVCKDRCWFKTYEPVEDGYVLYMGDDHFAPIHEKGIVVLEFSSGKSITMFNVLYVSKLCKNFISGPVSKKCGYKQVYESDKYILSKSGVFVGFGYYNNGMFMLNLNKVPDDSGSVYMSSSTVVNSSLWHARLGHVHYKRMLEMSKDDLIPAIDENPEKYTTLICEIFMLHHLWAIKRIIHETTAPYTPQQNGMAERKNRALKEMVNSMVPNKKNKTTPYELWYKKQPNLSYLRVWGCRAVVRLPDPKKKTLGEMGIDCIFVGYAENSKAYRFYVIEPNDSVYINSIIKSRDAIFDENRFFSIPRPKDIIPNLDESQRDDHSDDVPSETPEPRRGKRARKAKSYGSDFQLYLIKGSRDQVGSQYSYCYSIEEDPRIYNKAMQSRDAAFWKEAIDDEIGSIIENNTWVLSDLPPGCKLIFKRKMKVDGTIDKFKARLVIQGFRQKKGIDYFDTYAPVARITTIRCC
ncbi:zinc finger, CCHC-type containing protein [Tanacetum coccineum]